jgi:RNA polymerase sigma factor (sigma-70 family)
MATIAKPRVTLEAAESADRTAASVAIARSPADLALRAACDDREALAELQVGLDREEAWAVRLLVGALRERAPWAWKFLHTWYFGRLVGICLRILKDRDAAEDCALKVEFNFVTRYVDQPRALETFPGYLWSMAWTTALRWTPRWESVGLPNQLPGPPSRQEAASAALDRTALRGALDQLEPSQVELLRKRYAEGLTLREISEERGTSLQNVDQTIRRLLKRLRTLMTS